MQEKCQTRSRKEIWANEAQKYIPHILGLCDQNPLSPTYGCFDRAYWHYKTIDFPSGMYQENVLVLALIYKNNFPKNYWFKNDRIKELVCAGIQFFINSGHSDGAYDDYFPNEKALGATVFSVYAVTESIKLLNLELNNKIIRKLSRIGEFIIRHDESGQLSNHQALAALGLLNLYLITNDKKFLEGADHKINLTLSWQNDEGWFLEYEGCDPGYLSCTISYLAKYYIQTQDLRLEAPLKKALKFMLHFIHPDGSFGGEYGSRNSLHYYPSGGELLASLSPIGMQINDIFASGIERGKQSFYEDDRLVSHKVYDYLEAYLAYFQERPKCLERPPSFTIFPQAGFFIASKEKYYAIVALKKGGGVKAYTDKKCFLFNRGVLLRSEKKQYLSSSVFDKNQEFKIDKNSISLSRNFSSIKVFLTFTPLTFLVFRLVNLFLGKKMSRMIRKFIQSLIITRKKNVPINFKREIGFHDDEIIINDVISLNSRFSDISVGISGPLSSSLYTAASNVYQESQLMPHYYFTDHQVNALNTNRYLKINHRFSVNNE